MKWRKLDDYCLESHCSKYRVVRFVVGEKDIFWGAKRPNPGAKWEWDRSEETMDRCRGIWRDQQMPVSDNQ